MLSAQNLTKKFVDDAGEFSVIKDATFTINKGELVGLLGASGSGKTTLLQMLGALDRPTSGTVSINGKTLTSLTAVQLSYFRNVNLGFVYQFHHLLPDFTALENVAMPGLVRKTKRSVCYDRAKMLLDTVGLVDRASHFPSEMSGGERQRVALARALLNEPALVLADEPTGNLDKETGAKLLELILKANKTLNQTFLIATHNNQLSDAMQRILYIEDGKIISR